MRSRMQGTISSQEVHAVAREWLKPIGLKDAGWKCTQTFLWNLLLCAAARMCSIYAACRNLQEAPSDQAVRTAVRNQLPDEDELERRLNRALWTQIPRWCLKKRMRVAIDIMLIPYHGKPAEDPRELYHSQAKSGTTKFHGYATACVVCRGKRFTLALMRVRGGTKMDEVVSKLLRMLRKRGISLKLLLLDKGFFNAAVVRYLKRARVPFLMPVAFRGRKPKSGNAAGGLRSFVRRRNGWFTYALRTKDGGSERIRVCRASKRYKHRQSGKTRTKSLLFAAWGFHGDPVETRETYRQRFGIESSYRQSNQARIRTCTPDVKRRLLFFGIALVLRNVWVWLHLMCLARQPGFSDTIRLELLRFRQMLHWLELLADQHLGKQACCVVNPYAGR